MKNLSPKYLRIACYSIIILFSIFPIFLSFPFRINIFLSWEGAYRLYLGQIPFKDFGIPLGYGYWLIPAFFFKIFGPYLFTLILAQSFINFILACTFRNILKLFQVEEAVIFLSVFVLCISYIFLNYWPWYNHSAVVFGIIGINYLLKSILGKLSNYKAQLFYLFVSSFFIFLSFFTKQDYGALFFILAMALLAYTVWLDGKFSLPMIYILFTIIWSSAIMLPLLPYDFTYWFNFGQSPHSARLSFVNFLYKILGDSDWEKFYLLMIALTIVHHFSSIKSFFYDKIKILFILFTLGIFCIAVISKVTSVQVFGNEVFFHAFGMAYLLNFISPYFNWQKPITLSITCMMIFAWWSSSYWKYIVVALKLPPPITFNWEVRYSKPAWELSSLRSFKKVRLPVSTIKGIDRLMKLPLIKKPNLRVLNMTELTPLAYEMGYIPLKNQPLWYHMRVGMFKKEADIFCKNILEQNYDLVLFETISGINGFFPKEVQNCLRSNYRKIDNFEAPRRLEENSYIEVYVPNLK